MGYVIAISGGVDSVVLAHKLASKSRALALVHINHHTRPGENEKDLEIVKAIGKQYQLPVYVFDYFHTNGNFQQQARAFRYQKLVQIAHKYNRKIAVAHHLDDQLENALAPAHSAKSRLMSYRTQFEDITIYRPLLAYTKQQLYEEATACSYEYNEDMSNFENNYQRNARRLKLASNQKVKLAAIQNYMRDHALEQMSDLVPVRDELVRHKLVSMKCELATIYLYKLIKSKTPTDNLKMQTLSDILELLTKNQNSTYSLANYVELFVVYDKIYLLTKCTNYKQSGITTKGQNIFNGIKFSYEYEHHQIRVWQHGDRVAIKNGHKKVARIFIDAKIDPQQRKQWPIIVDANNEIIYIPHLWRKNETNK